MKSRQEDKIKFCECGHQKECHITNFGKEDFSGRCDYDWDGNHGEIMTCKCKKFVKQEGGE